MDLKFRVQKGISVKIGSPEDDERKEETIRSTREWIVRFTQPEQVLSYHWETEVGYSCQIATLYLNIKWLT